MTKLKTEKGLFWLTASGVLFSIINLIISLGTFFNWFEISRTLWLKELFLLGGYLLLFIIFIIGLVYLIRGRSEFGKKHSQSVKIGTIMIVISVIIYIILLVTYYVRAHSNDMHSLSDSPISVIISILQEIYNLSLFMGIVFLIQRIAFLRPKVILWCGFLIMVGLHLLLWVNGLFPRSIFFFFPYYFIPVSTYILLTLAFYLTYRDVKSGRIKPRKPRKREEK